MVDEKSPEIERQKIVLEEKKWVRIDFNNKEIRIAPYISLNNKIQLLKAYTESFFSEDEFYLSYIQAEYSIILAIVELCTDLDINVLKVDNIINSGLWDKIVATIENYGDFRKDIDVVVKTMREDLLVKKSVGGVIDNFAVKTFSIVEKISDINFSKENIVELIDKLGEINVKESFGTVEKTPRKKKNTQPKE